MQPFCNSIYIISLQYIFIKHNGPKKILYLVPGRINDFGRCVFVVVYFTTQNAVVC